MGYVGNQTTNSYSSLAKQTITGDGGTSYTLDHAVANAQEVEIFVNNVRQEPGVAYTVNGTALTMTGNVAASDDFYVVFQGKALQTVTPPDLSVTEAKLANSLDMQNKTLKGGTTDAITIDSSGRVLFPARPAFSAYASSGSPLTSAQTVVLPLTFTNQGSHYSTTTGQFTAPVAGTYYFHHHGTLYGAVSRSWDFEKNGTTVARHVNERVSSENGYYNVISGDIIIDMAANDTMEVALVGGTYYLGTAIVYRPVFCGYLLG